MEDSRYLDSTFFELEYRDAPGSFTGEYRYKSFYNSSTGEWRRSKEHAYNDGLKHKATLEALSRKENQEYAKDKWEIRQETSQIFIIENQDGYPIARTIDNVSTDERRITNSETNLANAHLISSAPDMCKAMKDLLKEPIEVADKGPIGGKTYVFSISKEKLDAANKALRKAGGKE